ncbi:SUKH-4 family immunity protein [Streptacidiphilus anmyonensis]|uniref:SUKH-4 family immunity protein n=1 Tax=Streptacidiphilus anmyonensis TaxID=405782 RepID=UPI0005A8BCDD|nr:SUKH-4 family immunity protein [Streptacidiphilus anmyonensis]
MSEVLEAAMRHLSVRLNHEGGALLDLPGELVTTKPLDVSEATLQDAGMTWIGDDSGTNLCISSQDGHLHAVPVGSSERIPNRFVSRSLDAFVATLGAYGSCLAEFSEAAAECDEDQATQTLDDLQRRISMIDPLALADAENWWSVILEQMADGLL